MKMSDIDGAITNFGKLRGRMPKKLRVGRHMANQIAKAAVAGPDAGGERRAELMEDLKFGKGWLRGMRVTYDPKAAPDLVEVS